MNQDYNNISCLDLNFETDAAAPGSFSDWLSVCMSRLCNLEKVSLHQNRLPSHLQRYLTPRVNFTCPDSFLHFSRYYSSRRQMIFPQSLIFFFHPLVVNKNLSWRNPAGWNASTIQFLLKQTNQQTKHLIYSGNRSSLHQLVMWFTYLGLFLIKHWSTNKQIIEVSGEAVDLRLTVAHLSLS